MITDLARFDLCYQDLGPIFSQSDGPLTWLGRFIYKKTVTDRVLVVTLVAPNIDGHTVSQSRCSLS